MKLEDFDIPLGYNGYPGDLTAVAKFCRDKYVKSMPTATLYFNIGVGLQVCTRGIFLGYTLDHCSDRKQYWWNCQEGFHATINELSSSDKFYYFLNKTIIAMSYKLFIVEKDENCEIQISDTYRCNTDVAAFWPIGGSLQYPPLV